jgi:hypothetical protein
MNFAVLWLVSAGVKADTSRVNHTEHKIANLKRYYNTFSEKLLNIVTFQSVNYFAKD